MYLINYTHTFLEKLFCLRYHINRECLRLGFESYQRQNNYYISCLVFLLISEKLCQSVFNFDNI